MIKEFLNTFLTQFSVLGFTSRLSQLTKSTRMKSVDRDGRPTCTDLCTFGDTGTVDRPGRPGLRAELSVCLGRPGRSTGSCQRAEIDRWTVDRQCISGISAANGYIFLGSINTLFVRVFL